MGPKALLILPSNFPLTHLQFYQELSNAYLQYVSNTSPIPLQFLSNCIIGIIVELYWSGIVNKLETKRRIPLGFPKGFQRGIRGGLEKDWRRIGGGLEEVSNISNLSLEGNRQKCGRHSPPWRHRGASCNIQQYGQRQHSY